jgi:LuxR family transcriptional regulator, maltose regulon positive regulatory protein
VRRLGLHAALEAARGLVLVSAPPGYGKTTLVAGWLAADGRAAAWLTLDPSDDDPAVFLAYLLAAVRRVVPELDPGAERGLAGTTSPAAALAPLLNALATLDRPLVLVLDDYHVIGDPRIHELTSFLATHLPANACLLLLTRQDPQLPLARLRVRGQLTEIRAGDLQFEVADAARFLGESMGLDLPEPTVRRLTERTEGWIAGLQLAALSLRVSRDPDVFVDAFGSSDRYIFEYLTDEALATLPPELRSFLEVTCLLERLSAPLCDAMTGRDDAAGTLDALAEANVFITSLDERREWYRYHRLFADLVASTLEDDRRTELHRRAAAWFAGHDLPAEAIRHWLAANAFMDAAALMEDVAAETVARGRFRLFMGWCDALPPGVLGAFPGLGVMRAWAAFLGGDIAGAGVALAALPEEPADHPASARRACLAAWFANRQDRADAEILARRAIAGIPESDPVFRSLAFTTLGESLFGRHVRRSVDSFAEAHRLARLAQQPVLLAGTVYSLGMTNLVLGRRRDAEALCRQAIDEATTGRPVTPPWTGMVHLPLGIALYEADELVRARQHIATGYELCEQAGLRVTMLGAAEWYEVLAIHLLGDRDQAWRRLESVRREGERVGLRRVKVAMTLLEAELLLLEGDAVGAATRLETLPPDHAAVLGVTQDRLPLTRARVDLAAGRPKDALRVLGPLAREQEADGRFGRLVPTLAATAAAHRALGDDAGAIRALEDAVRRAAAGDYRRAILDPVLTLGSLLPRVRPAAPAFVDALVGRSPGRDGDPWTREESSPGGVPWAVATLDGPPVEALSVRELEVLRLVATGLSNEEIGRTLFVSPGTAKWHVHNVIGKLGARNRVTLVARARALGLI